MVCVLCLRVFVFACSYATLVQRLLSMRLLNIRSGVSRNASFDFMNRELVWQQMTVRPPARAPARPPAD